MSKLCELRASVVKISNLNATIYPVLSIVRICFSGTLDNTSQKSPVKINLPQYQLVIARQKLGLPNYLLVFAVFFPVCPNTSWYLHARNLVCPNTYWYLLFFSRFAQIPVGICSPETWFASAQLGQAHLKLGLPLPSLGKPA